MKRLRAHAGLGAGQSSLGLGRPYRALLTAATAVLCLCVAACGGTGPRPGAASATASARHPGAGATAASRSGAVRPSPAVTGDYDSDDNYGHGPLNDGDDDDSKPTDRDGDADNATSSYFDRDDGVVRDFGHAAGPVQSRTIARLVRRYFAAAAAGDGRTACSMVLPSMARAIPEDFGRAPAPPYARGTTCASVMSQLFEHYHRQLAAHAPTLRVSAVRVEGSKAVVVLAFKGLPPREMYVTRVAGGLRMGGLFDVELP